MSEKTIHNQSISLNRNVTLHKYKLLGGPNSKIYMGTREQDGKLTPVIIKVLKIYGLSEVNYSNSLREIDIATDIMNNPNDNVIKIYDVIKLDDTVYIVMEYCSDGDLSSILIKPLKEHIAKYYFKQLALGVKYMQENKIIHRDIKPGNIMITGNRKQLKLSDFGLAKIHDKMKRTNTICGSPLYMAPELLNSLAYGEDVDIWALGIILYEMIFGMHPFKDCKDYEELQFRSTNDICIPPLTCGVNVSRDCVSILKKMLSTNKNRIHIDEILGDSWLKTVNEPEIISMKTMFVDNISVLHEDDENDESDESDGCSNETNNDCDDYELLFEMD